MTIEIFSEIAAERERQRSLGFTADHDAQHHPNDWVALLARHVGLSVDEAAEASDRFRRQLVRVTALALAAIESHDRRHPPGGPVTRASRVLVAQDQEPTPAPWHAVQAQMKADATGETWLWIDDPPPSSITGYQSRIPYLIAERDASEEEREVGKRFVPGGGKG